VDSGDLAAVELGAAAVELVAVATS
jgi:hypothetical protein